MSLPPPEPSHILRFHTNPITCLNISEDNLRIYVGDAAGNVTISSPLSLRRLADWKAHSESILGLQEWNDKIITHGRDHAVSIWERTEETLLTEVASSTKTAPTLFRTFQVNALNYCRFHLLDVQSDAHSETQALLVTPNLKESTLADIWSLPSCQILHSGIGNLETGATPSAAKTGIIMFLHLFSHQTDDEKHALRVLMAYENGSVAMWSYPESYNIPSFEGRAWQFIWSKKAHLEAVMAMAIAPDESFALTTSSEHFLVKYDIANMTRDQAKEPQVFTTKSVGNGSIDIRFGGRICAMGGWDGKIRLHSTKSGKSLGTLRYHKSSCQAVIFAHHHPELAFDKDDLDREKKMEIRYWLLGGSKDGRVSVWNLSDLGR